MGGKGRGGEGRGGERGEWASVASHTIADGKQCDAGNAGGEVQLVGQEVQRRHKEIVRLKKYRQIMQKLLPGNKIAILIVTSGYYDIV